MSRSSEVESSPSPGTSQSRGGLARRAFELSGIAPLGAYLVLHLWDVSRAMISRSAFEAAHARTAAEVALEVGLVWMPLVYHAGYGVGVLAGIVPRAPSASARTRRWLSITGVLSLVAIALHALHLRVPVATGRFTSTELFDELAAGLSSTIAFGVPALALGYLAMTLLIPSHLALGLYDHLTRRGSLGTTRRARHARFLLGAGATLLFLWGASTVIYFATGSTPLPSPSVQESGN